MFNKYNCVTCAPSLHNSSQLNTGRVDIHQNAPIHIHASQPRLNAYAKSMHYKKL